MGEGGYRDGLPGTQCEEEATKLVRLSATPPVLRKSHQGPLLGDQVRRGSQENPSLVASQGAQPDPRLNSTCRLMLGVLGGGGAPAPLELVSDSLEDPSDVLLHLAPGPRTDRMTLSQPGRPGSGTVGCPLGSQLGGARF